MADSGRADRARDPRRGEQLLRAGIALWGTWLIVLLVVFSASGTVNAY